MNPIIIILLLFSVVLQANDDGLDNAQNNGIDLYNVSTEGLDKAVAEVFEETRGIIEKARQDNNEDLEFSASKEWCLLLHNFDFLAQAKACYFAVGVKNKSDAKWPYLYGKASFEQGEMDDANTGFEQAIKRNANYLPAHYYRINMRLQDGNLKRAFELKSSVPPELQLTSSMLKLSGDLYFEVENYHVAIGYYQQALSLVEGANSLHYKIAQAYAMLDQQSLAETHLSQANEVGIKLLDPYYESVKNTTVGEVPYLIKAKAALVNGDTKQAIEGYEKALSYNPNSLTAQLNMAVAYFQDNNIDIAQSMFNKVLEQDPKQLTALYNLSIINKMQKNWNVAKDLLLRFLSIDGNDEGANISLAEVYYQLDRHDKVMQLANASAFKTNESMQILKAQSLVQMQQYKSAIELLQTIHKYRPNNQDVQLMLVKLYSQVPDVSLRDMGLAVEFAQKAVVTKKDVQSLWQLLLVLDQAKRCDEMPSLVDEMAQLMQIPVQEMTNKLHEQLGPDSNCLAKSS